MIFEEWEKGRRWLLVFPALWFGGYAAVAAFSHWQANRFNDSISKFNLGKVASFNQGDTDILILSGPWNSPHVNSLTAQYLVESWGLGRAYMATHPDNNIQEVELKKIGCPRTSMSYDGKIITNNVVDRDRNNNMKMTIAENLCIYFTFKSPYNPIIKIKPKNSFRIESWSISYYSQDIDMETASGQIVNLKSGWATPLTWIPMPILGCALDSSAPAWRCLAQFNQEGLYSPDKDLTPNGPDNVVARALNLPEITIRQRYPQAGWR